MNTIETYKERVFEEIKHIGKNGNEYWYARELMLALEYSKWENFNKVIEKAIDACQNSSINFNEHFPGVRKTLKMPNNATKEIIDYKLSRYACYLITQNADPRKKVVALGQTYFAIQTRKQELSEEEYEKLSENEKRIYHRNKVRSGNIKLNKTALNAGVKNFGEFHNAGYRGLYNGETANDIFKRKNLKYRQDILDFMDSDELIYNQFRISLTDQSINNNHIYGEIEACNTHNEVGKEVRKTIRKLGGTMPENLPTPNKSIDDIEIKEISDK